MLRLILRESIEVGFAALHLIIHCARGTYAYLTQPRIAQTLDERVRALEVELSYLRQNVAHQTGLCGPS